eukprot:jgi/Psemu1/282225/fgenesh1_pg.4_\
MFVATLLADLWQKLDQNISKNRQDSNTYEDFLEDQKNIWTPHELYEKCCPRFLAGGVSHRYQSGQFVCFGTCRKVHPTITLYFDANKACTVAAPSFRLDPFVKYLDQRVKEGSAVSKSPYYYELEGFLRENLHRMRHQQRLFGGHLVNVAIGALKESDEAQAKLLEEAHVQQLRRRHSHIHSHSLNHRCLSSHHRFDSEPNPDRASMEIESSFYQDVEKLEVVLEICRLWGLGDHLDVLSIDCMSRTSRVFRQVAIPMAERRVEECQFIMTPLVDGHFISGYSVFRRANDDRQKVFERENGRLVEYAVCPSVLFCQKRKGNQELSPDHSVPGKNMSGRYFPELRSNVSYHRSSRSSSRSKNEMETDSSADFSWACEELSFANLELECMNIGLQEYIGQKLIIQWRRNNVDIPDQRRRPDPSAHDEANDVPIFRLAMGWAPQEVGIVDLSVPHFGLKLHVPRNSASQVDDVTFCYQGNAKVLECKTDFAFLVAAYARSLQPHLIAYQKKIEMDRPLLRHEQEFFEEVQRAASLCPSSQYSCSKHVTFGRLSRQRSMSVNSR